MPADLAGLLADLAAETAVLDSLVARLDEARWRAPTPAPGWSIHDQVTHLAYFDETAAQAAADPDGFRAGAAELILLGDTFPDEIARRHAALPPAGALAWFRRARAGYLATFRGLDPRQRLPWYGPDMSAASSVTARLMETWAHGQDIADTLGVWRPPSARLRHVAHLGVMFRHLARFHQPRVVNHHHLVPLPAHARDAKGQRQPGQPRQNQQAFHLVIALELPGT